MSEAGNSQGRTERHVNISSHETPDLTADEQDFLKMLCRVLPKLISMLEKPTDIGDPSPLLTQDSTPGPDEKSTQSSDEESTQSLDEECMHKMSSSLPSFAETQKGLDSGGDQDWGLILNLKLHCKCLWGEFANSRLTCTARACSSLHLIIWRFRKFEKRIRPIDGGAQLMDALVELQEATGDGSSLAFFLVSMITQVSSGAHGMREVSISASDLDTVLSTFGNASDMLYKAFKNLGEDLPKGTHLGPLDSLRLFCWVNINNSKSVTNEEHIEDLLSLATHIYDVSKGLSEFFESSFPEFLKAREKAQSIDYNNMLTAATFFSAVTATTMQLSYAYNTNTRASLGVAVNTLWFVALVFSTASGLNSLVGLTWYQKIRQKRLLPGWAKLWLAYGPTTSLAIASAAFSAGLCIFAFSSSQHTITSALTATFTVAHAVALFVLLCLYSPNQSLLEYWYLRNVPPRDRARVVDFMRIEGLPRSGVNIACNFLYITQTDPLSTRVKKNLNKAWTSVLLSARSVVAWVITRCSHWLALFRRRVRDPKELRSMEQVSKVDTRVVTPSELERGNELREHDGEPEIQIPNVTEGQGITPFERPRISTPNVTKPEENAALVAKGPGEKISRGCDTSSTLELIEESISVISSTADPIPGPGSIQTVQNSDNGLRQETDALERPKTSQEEESGPPFSHSAQEGFETHNTNVSDPTFKVECEREVAFEESSPSPDIGSTGGLK